MLQFSNSFAIPKAVPSSYLTNQQLDALDRVARAFRVIYPEIETLSRPFDADVAASEDDTTPDDPFISDGNNS